MDNVLEGICIPDLDNVLHKICMVFRPLKMRKLEKLSLPFTGFFKFNADSVARGKPVLAGFRGVLSNN